MRPDRVASAGAPERQRKPPARGEQNHQWSPTNRAILTGTVALLIACLYILSYSLALGNPVAHKISAALIGDQTSHARAVNAVERTAHGDLALRSYPSLSKALRGLDQQTVYAALDVTGPRPALYVASAAGASVAHVLERATVNDPALVVIDKHPLPRDDFSGVDIFYLMLVGTLFAFLTVFQTGANAPDLSLRRSAIFVACLAVLGSLALTLVGGALIHGFAASTPELWGILALDILTVASFALLMSLLIRRWATVPTFLFFIVLGNTASGGTISAPMLRQPFGFLSNWLPSGATVTALRNAIYFYDYQHVQPIAVLVVWASATCGVLFLVIHRRRTACAATSQRRP